MGDAFRSQENGGKWGNLKEGEIWAVLSREGFGQEGHSGGGSLAEKGWETYKVGVLGTQN